MPSPSSPSLSRRRFLAAGGITAGAVLLGACGGGDDDAEPPTDDGGDSGNDRGLALAAFFGGPTFVAGRPLRAPFGIVDRDALLTVEETPAELEAVILDADEQQVGDAISIARHAEGLPRAYFPLTATVDAPGLYTLRSEVDGVSAELSFEVHAAEEVRLIQAGTAMPTLESPTTADARGVTPICTREPACPLHDVTLAEALGAGQPIAFLVSTPGYCQLSICGPVLDVLLGVAESHPDLKLLHQEVYADPTTDLTTFAPGLDALGLHFEPALFLVGADGSLRDRLDVIFDEVELGSALARLTA